MARLTRHSYIKISLICLLCLIICGFISGAFHLVRSVINAWQNPLSTHEQPWISDSATKTGDFTINAADVSDMSINWLAGKVTINVVDDEETDGLIHVSETTHKSPALRWQHTDGKLEIDYSGIQNFIGCTPFFNSGNKEMTMIIPRSHADQFNNIELDAASGEYQISGLGCKSLNIDQASGSINMSEFVATDAVFKVASGAFSYKGDVTNKLDIDQASGNMTMQLCSYNPKNSDLKMASGELNLILPVPDFVIDLDKVSGNFNCDYSLLNNGDDVYYCKLNASDTNASSSSASSADASDSSAASNSDATANSNTIANSNANRNSRNSYGYQHSYGYHNQHNFHYECEGYDECDNYASHIKMEMMSGNFKISKP